LKEEAATHLYRPPPVSSVHLIINEACLRGVGVVVLWGKDEIMCKLGVAKESPDTHNNVTIMELEVFTSNNEILALKWGGTRQLLVNEVVKLLACVIQQSEAVNKLW